jgi:hypothetical protein
MAPLSVGSPAPSVFGIPATEEPRLLFFYKVTCPVCQMAAPKVENFELGYPGLIRGVGQDPPDKLVWFSSEHGVTFRVRDDPSPYPASRAYGIRVVPTLFLIEAGVIMDVVESWDRDRLNALSQRVASTLGAPYRQISDPSDGLPVFRPG